jgi:hypothetical protein
MPSLPQSKGLLNKAECVIVIPSVLKFAKIDIALRRWSVVAAGILKITTGIPGSVSVHHLSGNWLQIFRQIHSANFHPFLL